MDRTEAMNIAFALYFSSQKPSLEELRGHVLAVWYFFSPDWLQGLKGNDLTVAKNALARSIRPSKTGFQELNKLCEEQSQFVIKIDQYHGDVVHVPPGWAHMVSVKRVCP